jgi:hypothetical protein
LIHPQYSTVRWNGAAAPTEVGRPPGGSAQVAQRSRSSVIGGGTRCYDDHGGPFSHRVDEGVDGDHRSRSSSDYIADDFAVIDLQPLAAGHLQPMRVQPELVQDRGVHVGDVVPVLRGVES